MSGLSPGTVNSSSSTCWSPPKRERVFDTATQEQKRVRRNGGSLIAVFQMTWEGIWSCIIEPLSIRVEMVGLGS